MRDKMIRRPQTSIMISINETEEDSVQLRDNLVEKTKTSGHQK